MHALGQKLHKWRPLFAYAFVVLATAYSIAGVTRANNRLTTEANRACHIQQKQLPSAHALVDGLAALGRLTSLTPVVELDPVDARRVTKDFQAVAGYVAQQPKSIKCP